MQCYHSVDKKKSGNIAKNIPKIYSVCVCADRGKFA